MSTTSQPTQGAPKSKGQAVAIALIALIFGAGFASGWFAHRASSPTLSAQSKRQGKRTRRKRGSWRKRFVKRLTQRLQLTQAQADQIDAAIKKHQPQYRKVKRSIRPALAKIRKDMRSDIKALLKPDQQARFQKMLDDYKARRAQRRRRRKK